MLAKICGLSTREAIESAVDYGADFLGFVFFEPSPRYVQPENLVDITKGIASAKTVGVFVDASDAYLTETFEHFTPDFIQCHGAESVKRVEQIRNKFDIPIIKAIQVRSGDDISQAKAFIGVADMLLFDAKVPSSALPGGNGLAFDWNLLQQHSFDCPWFLSGGINIDNVMQAVEVSGAKAVDVSSSLESAPGVKNPELIRVFLEKVKTL